MTKRLILLLSTTQKHKMPPKQRTGSVSKQCEECGGANPVACKICKKQLFTNKSNKLVQTLMPPTVYKLVNRSLLKSLLVTSVAKFNPLTLVFTFKYKVL